MDSLGDWTPALASDRFDGLLAIRRGPRSVRGTCGAGVHLQLLGRLRIRDRHRPDVGQDPLPRVREPDREQVVPQVQQVEARLTAGCDEVRHDQTIDRRRMTLSAASRSLPRSVAGAPGHRRRELLDEPQDRHPVGCDRDRLRTPAP